jgi:CubicO group peptidase (beta-lactamase class C family)
MTLGPAPSGAQPVPQPSASVPLFKAEAPRFADPERRSKLATAFPEIDRLMQDFAAREHVPGATWGIVIDGELAHVGVTGSRDLASKAPVGEDTVFRIASMTKSFTAMAILKLRDEGKLALDDPAEKYVPELARLTYPTSDSPKITVRHLLSHSEGFPEDNPWGDQQLSATDEQFTLLMRRGIPFSNPPGVAYEYSNYGFAILGRIVSKVSGVPYKAYVAANILKPLGMSSTTLEPNTGGKTSSGKRNRSCRTARLDRWAACSPRSGTSRATWPRFWMRGRRGTVRRPPLSRARRSARCSRCGARARRRCRGTRPAGSPSARGATAMASASPPRASTRSACRTAGGCPALAR